MDKQPIMQQLDDDAAHADDDAADNYDGGVQLHKQPQHRVYWQRWFVLGIYGLLITFQGSLWNTWGPLHDNMKLAYSWDEVTFGLLPFWGPFCYVLAFFPITLLINSRGLRSAVLLSAGLVTVAAVAKTPAALVGDETFRLLCHVCGFLNGLAAPALFTTPPLLAAAWFPRNERVTATAVGGSCQSLAIAASFLIGPLFVPEVANNGTDTNSTMQIIQQVHDEVNLLNYVQAATAAAIFICIIIYFPSKPPTPPALSCEVARSDMIGGLRSLPARTWLIVVAYGLPLGVSAGFSAAFDDNISGFGIGQTQAGWMGFAAVLAGTAVSLAVASVIDRLPNLRMKWVNAALMSVATICYIWFTAALTGLLPASTVGIYTANILANVALCCSLPIFYELACEAAFPIAEEVPAMLITATNCVFASAFLAAMFAPQLGTRWMNFAMTAACAAAVPLLVVFKEEHNRRDLDVDPATSSVDELQSGSANAAVVQ